MKKKGLKCVILILLLFIALTHGITRTTIQPAEKTTEIQTEYQNEPTEAVQIPEDSGEDVQALVEKMLAFAGKKFYQDYPVDEAFINWIGSTYGTSALKTLADQLESDKGKSDPALWYTVTGSSMHVLWLSYCRQHAYMSYLYPDILWKEASDPSCIKLDFIGDICFADDWFTMKKAEKENGIENCFSEAIVRELNAADFTMANNEFVYTSKGEKQEGKAYCFRTAPEMAEKLNFLGCDMVSVANNHVYDYGEEGFLDTLDALKKAGIVYSGGGKNIREASAVRYIVTGGRKIAIVSATEIERFYHFTKEAGENSPGVLKTQQKEILQKTLQEAKENSDYVIAYIHWGTEGKIRYGKDQQELAELCAKAGADAVIGGHPHRLQGVGFVGDVPVAYSLGNFWLSNANLYTAIAQIQIDDKGNLTLCMIPCVQKGTKTSLLAGEKNKKKFYQYIADNSKDIGIDKKGCVYFCKDTDNDAKAGYAYTSGRRYGQHFDDVDLDLKSIDIVGNLQ